MIPDKIKSSLFLLLASGIGVSGMHAKDLSVVEVIGNKYYVYEVKKGDSIYGIAKSNGWDVTELERLNPNTVRNLKKGDRLYYPLEKGKPISADAVPESVSAEYIEPIAHIVKRGETV